MLPQLILIERLRQLCEQDQRLTAAMLYGSFTTGEGDAFSDIECLLYFDDTMLPQIDRAGWVAQIAPLALFFADDFGHYTAIFESLIRGEFHFKPASSIGDVTGWQGNVWFPSLAATLLVDRLGLLAPHLQPFIGKPPPQDSAQMVERLINNFINSALFGSNTLARGELARSLEILGMQHRYLLWMARLVECKTDHWATPSRAAEKDLSPDTYARLKSCTAALDEAQLQSAYQAAWNWGIEMLRVLAERHQLALPDVLIAVISDKIN